MGAGKIVMAVFGVSVTAGAVLYFVLGGQEELKVNFHYVEETFQKEDAQFNQDFAQENLFMADSKAEAKVYSKQEEIYGIEVASIELKREAEADKLRIARERSEANMADIDNELNFNESDLDF